MHIPVKMLTSCIFSVPLSPPPLKNKRKLGLLIGSSFVFKKKGLINCTKHGMLAGEGHAYLKSVMWWTGMVMSKVLFFLF